MNSDKPVSDPKKGILLSDTVDMAWLRSVTPRYYNDYIKFVVDLYRCEVYVGMDFHADCVPGSIDAQERSERFRGGNIYFDDGRIVYESTLNIPGNLAIGGVFDDIRIICDQGTIDRVNAVLFKWVVM